MTVPLYKETVPQFKLNQIQLKWCDTKLHFIRNSQRIHVHNMRDKTQNLWFMQMPSQGETGGRKIFAFLSTYSLFVEQPVVSWSFSGWWRLCGNDQQCLAAPNWKYRSGFGDHRFTFFIDLLPNSTFYTNLINIVHLVVTYRDVAHLIMLNWGKVEKKYAKSFDAGLSCLHTKTGMGCSAKLDQLKT